MEYLAIIDPLTKRLEEARIQPGDRIAVLHKSDIQYVALFFAAWRLGAVVCPLNTRLPPSQIALCLQRLDPALFIDSFERPFCRKEAPKTEAPTAVLLFTSGSTGVPKIAALSLKNLLANASSAVDALDLKEGDEWLLNLPLFHVSGIGIMLRSTLAKAKIIFDEKRGSITHISCVAAQLYRQTPVYKHLRCLLLGGGPIFSFPKQLPVYATYGMTEMGSIIAVKKDPVLKEGHFYLGHPLKGREVKLAEDGEILVKGECLFQGYWEGRMLAREEWFATRDLGKWCPKEGLAVIGRKDRQFISGGENIQPEEIEKELLQMPQILGARVTGVDDPEFGKRPIAFIDSFSKVTLKEVQKFLAEKLPKYKIPTAIFLSGSADKKLF